MRNNILLKTYLHSLTPPITNWVTQSVKMGICVNLEILNIVWRGFSSDLAYCYLRSSQCQKFKKTFLHNSIPSFKKWECASILRYLILPSWEAFLDLAKCYLKESQYHESLYLPKSLFIQLNSSFYRLGYQSVKNGMRLYLEHFNTFFVGTLSDLEKCYFAKRFVKCFQCHESPCLS